MESSTARGLRVDGDLASDMKDAFAHADQPQPAFGKDHRTVESATVIGDSQGNRTYSSAQFDARAASAAVFDDISQTFLRDPIQA